MQFVAKVISVEGPSTVKTAKGQYNFLEINYKRDGKVEGKKLMDFVNKNVYNIVKNVKAGETITVESAKDAKDYWQWTDVKLGGDVAAESNTSTSESSPSTKGTRITGSTYETPEERKIKQRNITRQFAINAAISYCTAQQTKFGTEVVYSIAGDIESWVYREDPVEKVIEMKDDIPV